MADEDNAFNFHHDSVSARIMKKTKEQRSEQKNNLCDDEIKIYWELGYIAEDKTTVALKADDRSTWNKITEILKAAFGVGS